ncbi:MULTISPECIES: glycoside hydrolase family 57 protein [unclassified Lebetimonas]|uniref:glycoside hydrolase family 57 protein n=1 Tax=unclassified Lebetimonas TaxID=2648158 RepID=UPI000463DF35|nr:MULTISPECIES: glycoside hydrolase family 57 protein [unclassified Lebetimonas]
MDSISILWHMHQPFYYYKNKIYLPWVFLHAIKDYYDMANIAGKYNVKTSFNLTPSLLIQLNEIDEKKDYFISLLLKRNLQDYEKNFILNIIKSVYVDTMVKPYKRFYELFNKKDLSDSEFNDLEVFYLLGWCGEELKNRKFIQNYLNKDTFTYEEKEELVFYLLEFVKKIIPFYKFLQDSGKIQITTTPFSHPILPLLFNMENAKKANPFAVLPKIYFSLKDDAIMHIKKAKEVYKKFFGVYPKAFWPAEGAISEEVIKAFKEEGIEITFSGDDVLKKVADDIYTPYEFEGVKLFFRDRYLSDLIGFNYKYFEADAAVSHFEREIESRSGNITVILDGENAWEYYKKPYEFLHKFYQMLENENTKFFDEVDKTKKLNKIIPGSWINGDFNTWVGDEEKNRAWEMLFLSKKEIPEDENYLYAEGSDWFWWYGKGHTSIQNEIYDEIFRNYLIDIFKKHNREIPAYLLIKNFNKKQYFKPQKFLLTPKIDGKTDFFEWVGSGEIEENFGALASSLPKIYYAIDENNLYLRIDDTNYLFEGFKNIKGKIIEAVGKKKEFLKFILKSKNFEMILPSEIIKLDINEIYKNWFV